MKKCPNCGTPEKFLRRNSYLSYNMTVGEAIIDCLACGGRWYVSILDMLATDDKKNGSPVLWSHERIKMRYRALN